MQGTRVTMECNAPLSKFHFLQYLILCNPHLRMHKIALVGLLIPLQLPIRTAGHKLLLIEALMLQNLYIPYSETDWTLKGGELPSPFHCY